jgi:hypothetical protein
VIIPLLQSEVPGSEVYVWIHGTEDKVQKCFMQFYPVFRF